jgi:hypothetical protein
MSHDETKVKIRRGKNEPKAGPKVIHSPGWADSKSRSEPYITKYAIFSQISPVVSVLAHCKMGTSTIPQGYVVSTARPKGSALKRVDLPQITRRKLSFLGPSGISFAVSDFWGCVQFF